MIKRTTGLQDIQNNPNVILNNKGIFAGRVKYCLLDNKTYPEVFSKFGEWSSIGSIFFSKVDAPNPEIDFSADNFARPLFSNNKVFPLNNEIVYIIPLPNNNIQNNINEIDYYYFQPINIWNSIHHNAIPNPINTNTLPTSQQRDYTQIEGGAMKYTSEQGSEINLGYTFKEKTNIKNIQPFEGDILYEGRWGQSIRFGSTVNNSVIPNLWSNSGDNGNPITIIRNGQHDDKNEPWIPQVEDINKDASSIYLTNTQQIPIDVSSKKYNSYKTHPINPEKYKENQIIINSDRLLFNSKKDSILFSSKDSINLNSINSVNLDTPNVIMDSKNILMGGKDANESIILGDTFLNDFQLLLNNILLLSNALQTPIGSPVPYVPNSSIVIPAVNLSQIAQNISSNLKKYKSLISKTK